MAVRAKFSVQKVERMNYRRQVPGAESGTYEDVEMQTIHMSPVYSGDPAHENRRFWDASPSGALTLGTINPQAWEQFELGAEYYLDFTRAP